MGVGDKKLCMFLQLLVVAELLFYSVENYPDWLCLMWFLSNLNAWLGFLQAITSTGTKKGELFLADVSTKLTNKNITTDVKVDTNSNVSGIFLYVLSSMDTKFMMPKLYRLYNW